MSECKCEYEKGFNAHEQRRRNVTYRLGKHERE
jgi:hypothetical protein